MPDLVFTRGKGRGVEWSERINANDPAASALILDVLATAGLETDTVLRQKDTFADLVSGATNFVTQPSIRKTLDNTAGITVLYDDTNHRTDVDIPDQTWTAVGAGDGWSRFVSGYDSDTGAGTDANILPWTFHDFVVVPDGSDITAQINAAGIFRAT